MAHVILGVLVAACVLAFEGAARADEPPPLAPMEDPHGFDTDLAPWVHHLAENAALLAREDSARRARLDLKFEEAEIARMDLLHGGIGLAFAGAIIGIALVRISRRARTDLRHRSPPVLRRGLLRLDVGR
jgi:hypothetical protein